jgi:hypothetical protein
MWEAGTEPRLSTPNPVAAQLGMLEQAFGPAE